MVTKRVFEKVADVMAKNAMGLSKDDHQWLVEQWSDIFQAENPNFDRQRFAKACMPVGFAPKALWKSTLTDSMVAMPDDELELFIADLDDAVQAVFDDYGVSGNDLDMGEPD